MRHAFTLLAALLLAATAAAAPKPPTPTDVLAQLPDFPSHWNQAHLYNQVIRDEYGNSAPAGCVPVAGAACMDWFDFPAAFGARAFPGVKRELRTETLDWARLAPTPLDARGRRTAQTILYNLGLYGQIYYVSGGSSTMPLQYLAAVLTSKEVGYASAYFVEFGSNATDAEVETTIWASLRCGSPVAMSISRDGGAHAVVATGCGTDESGVHLTQVFGGYGSAPTWMDVPTQMPVPGGYTYNKLASVVTGIVPKRPEGVDSGLALPVLGTVKDDTEGKPVPFAKVTLSIGGKVVAETATDLQGRYGLWGWFGHAMTVSCGETNQDIPAQAFPGSFDWDTNNLLGTGNWEVSASALADAIERVTVNFALPAVERPTIYTSLKNAKAEATAKGQKILCLSDEDPDLKAAFRTVTDAVLLYADPRLDAPFHEVDSIPDATAFVLDATGTVKGYSTSESLDTNGLNRLVGKPSIPSIDATGTKLSWNEGFSGKNVKVKNDDNAPAVATVTGDVRLGTLTVNAPLTVTGDGTLTWATLVQNDPIILDGPNLRYVVPKKDGESSYFSKSVTVQNGAELYFGVGDVSGYGYTEAKDKAITIGQGGILCVVSRDTLTRRLILDGGHIDLGNRDTSGGYGFGSLDLLHTIVEVKGDSSVAALSGVGNAALCIRGSENAPVTKFQFTNDARLDCPVLVAKPKNAGDQGKLQLTGDGVAAFGTVEVPTMVSGGVLLEGGTFSGGLSLTDGARLSALHPITVTGALTVSGTVTIEEARSGVFLRGNATTTIATTAFTAPSGFTVKKVGNDYRLVATTATAPVWYADGVRVEAKPGDAAPENSLLVLTTTDRKESGLWEGYAAFRSSPAGGGWNVCVAANGSITEGDATGYIQSAGCKYVLIGASAAEIPALADATDRLAGFHVGRLPLRESIRMGTVEDVGSLGQDGKQVYVNRSDAELIEAYVAKLVKAGDTHARGKLSLLGGGYGVPAQYSNDTDFTQWDGLPSIEDSEAWTKPTARGLTVYALRDRYRLFKTAEPAVFPDLTLYDDVTIPLGIAPNGLAYGRGIIGKTDGALLWVEDRGRRNRLSTICVNGTGNGTVTAEAIPGLYALAVTPSGQSGDFSQADSPSVGEMLVLNPQGGALSVLAPTGTDETLTISDTGIPSSNTHTVCAAVAEALIETPSLTVGQAFSQALTANPGLSTTLALLGDPTVRVMAWPEPEPLLPEGATLAEETLDALRAVAEQGGLFKDYEVTVTSLNGVERPIAELDDALACFPGLEPTVEPTVEGGKVVVAYDFGVTGLRVEGKEVVVTLSVRGKAGQGLTFAEGNAYAIAPQSLDGTQILAEPPAVTPPTPTADGTVELRFTLPEASDTFLFRARVSPR